ncbi:MAG: beta-lactamase [Phenylobacterium sp.]|nr:beta-lactamase [Phenylobacterium sp.]
MRRRFVLALAALALGAARPAAAESPACQAAEAYSAAHDGLSVLILWDGRTVCEAYSGEGAADRPAELWSGTKSFVGLMLGAAVQDRLISLDERVADTLPEWRADPWKSQVTVRQLLNLSSGLKSTIGQVPEFKAAVAMPLTAPPNTLFQYGPAPYQVFGEVMRRKLAAAGQPSDPLDYLRRRVLAPIGLQDVKWRRLPNGDAFLPQGAILTAREWAGVGEFVRGGGRVAGKPILDLATFHALFTPSEVNPAYGITWWLPNAPKVPDPVSSGQDMGAHAAELPRDMVVAAGAGDQRLYVIPSLKLTVVRQAVLQPGFRQRRDPAARWSDAAFVKLAIAAGR